jgi:uncharacterized membrane protein YccC
MRCAFPPYGATDLLCCGMMLAEAAAKYRTESRQVVRALTAASLSFLIAETLALPQSYWAVITALIIIQGSLGGTLAAAIDRILGTVAGAALGVAAALARGFWQVPEIVLLVLAVAPVSLLAAIRPSFRIAPVTAAIVVLASSGRVSPIEAAFDRVVEIALGTAIGIAVSILVLPSRARQICFERSAELLILLAQRLVLHLQPPAATKQEDVERLGERIRAGLAPVATAAQEARHEHTIRLDEDPVPERLVRALRRLHMDVVFVGRATAAIDFDWRRLGPVLGEVAASFRAIFETLAGALRQGNPDSAPSPDFTDLDQAIAKLRGAVDAGAGDPAALRAASVLPFVIETLRRDLGELADALARPATS